MKIDKIASSEISNKYILEKLKKEAGGIFGGPGKGIPIGALPTSAVTPSAVAPPIASPNVIKPKSAPKATKIPGEVKPKVLKEPISTGAAILEDGAAEILGPSAAKAIQDFEGVIDIKRAENIKAAYDATGEVGKHNRVARDALRELKEMEGLSDIEKAERAAKIMRSLNSAKGATTKANNALAIAGKKSAKFEAELAEKAAVNAALTVKMNDLLTEVSRLGGVVTEQSQIIAQLRRENDLLKGTDNALKVQGTVLEPAQKGWLATFLEKSGLAGFSKATHDKLSSAKKADTPAGVVAKEISDDAQKQADESLVKLTNDVPQAKPTIEAAGEVAKERGVKKSAEVVGETAEEVAKPGMLSRMSSGISKIFQVGLERGSERSITGVAIFGGAAILGKAIKYSIIFGAVGVASYYIWRTYLSDSNNAETVKQETDILESRIKDTIAKLEALKFKIRTDGDDETDNLIDSLKASLSVLQYVYSSQANDEDYKKAFETLEITQSKINSYLDKKEILVNDLETSDGWLVAIDSLEALNEQFGAVKIIVAEAIDVGSTSPYKEVDKEVMGPVGRVGDESATQNEKFKGVPVPVEIYGEKIDIGHTSPGFRSTAPRMIETLLKSPEGLAFIDPENKWGGYLSKSGNNQNDYLRSLYYLYKNQIFNGRQLRRFVRENMFNAGRRRHSGWKNAVKYYRNRAGKYANINFSENLHKNLQKTANFYESDVKSNDRRGFDMEKKADQISKEYFQDAVKGLSDQYAKSYYTGLKSMYDQKLGKTKADYNSLYKLHYETGTELIGEAHPLSIDIADAMGRGGVVENVVEQHRHNEGVALSMPSGNFRGKHAWLIKNLVKLADVTDEKGMGEASDLIDIALNEIISL
jgi:hypothetical protein